MNPLTFVLPELHSCIFQHFNPDDFKTATRISPSWNDALGKSRVMMKRIKLYLGSSSLKMNKDQLSEMVKVISGSTRQYPNMSVDFMSPHLEDETLHKILKYFSHVGPALCELEAQQFTDFDVENAELFDEIDLSKLEYLKMDGVSEKVAEKMLSRCSSLEKLELGTFLNEDVTAPNYQPSIPSLQEFLGRNQRLKKIKLFGHGMHGLFFEKDISEIVTFQLTHLYIVELSTTFWPSARNFIKFLATQSHSLECIYIHEYRPKVIEYVFNKIPRLKHLSIWADFKTEDLKLKVNNNVVNLSLRFFSDPASFRKIIPNFPKLTKFAVKVLTPETIAVISSKLPSLRTLLFSVCTTTADGPAWKTLFPNATPKRVYSRYGQLWSIEK